MALLSDRVAIVDEGRIVDTLESEALRPKRSRRRSSDERRADGHTETTPWGQPTIAGLVTEAGRLGVPILLIVVAAMFSVLQPDGTARGNNFRSILDTNSEIVIMALGAMLPLVAGEFDLSVPANAGLANVILLELTVNHGRSRRQWALPSF